MAIHSRRRALPPISCFLVLWAGIGACEKGSTAPDTQPPASEPPPPTIAPAVTTWLDAHGHPFQGSHLSLDPTELAFLDGMVGGARIVALGENTHGTRDFFEMKARILRYLVEKHGFNAFAIEATWPEAWRLDRYVRTGEGDPEELLSGLYFWTWNTESVLEMIEWMRAHNAAGGDIGFYGVDMQFPGMALDNVLDFFQIVDPDRLSEVENLLSCMADVANGPDGQFPQPGYSSLPASERAACGTSLEAVRVLLLDGRSEYEAMAGAEEFAIALQNLRVATQYHESAQGEQARDASMAENTIWLADHLGADSRIVLWAHNFHVADVGTQQGAYLRDHFRDELVIVGFTHVAGQFTAVRQEGNGFAGLQTLSLDPVRPLSYEAHLGAASTPTYVLDLRPVNPTESGAEWLGVARDIRFIGCCYDPAVPSRYWGPTDLRAAFDVIIHYDRTGPTTPLPFRPPSRF